VITIIFDKTMIGQVEKYVLSGFINNVWFVEKEYTMSASKIEGFALFARNNGQYYFDNLSIEAVPDVYPDGSFRRANVGMLYSAFSFDGLSTTAMVRGFSEGNFRPTTSGEYATTFGTLTNDSYNKFHINPEFPDSVLLNPTEGVISVDAKIANRGTFNRFAIDFNFGNYGIGNEYRLNVNIHGNGNSYMDLNKLTTGQVAKTWEASPSTIVNNIKLSFNTYYTYKLYYEINAAGFYVLSVFVDDVLVLEHVTATTAMGPTNVKGFGLVVNRISDTSGDFTSDVTFDNLYIAALQDRYVDGSALRKTNATRQYARYTFESNGTHPLFAEKEGSGFVLDSGKIKTASTNEFNVMKFLSRLDEFAFDVDIIANGDGTGGLRFGYDTAMFFDVHFQFNAGGGTVTVYQGEHRYQNFDANKGGKVMNPGLYPDVSTRIGVIVETLSPTLSNLAVFVNGVCVIETVVDKVPAGRFGVVSNNSDIAFDNLLITALGESTYYDGTELRLTGTPSLDRVYIHFDGWMRSDVEFGTNQIINVSSGSYPIAIPITSMQWRINGIPLEGATQSRLSLTAMDYFGLGTLTVDCVYNGDVISNPLTFFVSYDSITGVLIESDQVLQTVLETALLSASFTPTENTNPNPTVTWRVNGSVIFGEHGNTYAFQRSTPGHYRVTASVGEVISNEITIEVTYATLSALVIESPRLTMTTFEELTVTLLKTPSSGLNPALVYGWIVNGVDQQRTGNTFAFTTLTPGTYVIQAYQGALFSNELTIEVAQGVYATIDHVLLQSFKTTMTISETVTFEASFTPSAETDPALRFQWSVNGIVVEDQTSAVFVFGSTVPGSYEIRVSYGGVQSLARVIDVTYVPFATIGIDSNLSSITVVQSTLITLVLSPITNTDPNPSIVWKVNGSIIANQMAPTFTFANSIPGTYQIVAEVNGVSSNPLNVSVTYVPVAGVSLTTNVSAIKSNQSATLSVALSPSNNLDPGLSITWYVNGTAISNHTETTFVLEGVEAGNYVITCKVGSILSNQVTIVVSQAFRFDIVGYVSGGVTILAAVIFFLLKRARKF
jgi:hypothetical protein